jgi:5'-3' exonuclease
MLAIIDGDMMLHYACRKRWKAPTGVQVVSLDEKGIKQPLKFTKEEDARYLEKCYKQFNRDLDEVLGKIFATDFVMAVGNSRDNFRLDMYPDYKANRRTEAARKNKNPFVPILQDMVIKEGIAVTAQNEEADDLVRTWAEEARRVNQPFVVCSGDKDLKCIPGKFYDLKKKTLETISEIEAMRHYYAQLLEGDSTDNIPGVPGIGPITAKKETANCDTEEEMQELVVSHYIAAYEEGWKDFLLANGKMIHIKKHAHDFFTLKNWPIVQELS